jgi:hypothetical protein
METIESLRDRLEALENQTQAFAKQMRAAERRLHCWRRIAYGLLIVGLVSLPMASGITAQDESSEYRGMRKRLAALEYKLQYITGGPNEVVITGANLRIVNGLGSTNSTNDLGNLIVGYNESRVIFGGTDDRTGSHNVVVGEFLNFSSFGGLVVGHNNEVSGEFSSVSGGEFNTASGVRSSVSGGSGNTANGFAASVSGGEFNTASSFAASVSGGSNNTASGPTASVSGGEVNTATATSPQLAAARLTRRVAHTPQSVGDFKERLPVKTTGRLVHFSPRSKGGTRTKTKEGPCHQAAPPSQLRRDKQALPCLHALFFGLLRFTLLPSRIFDLFLLFVAHNLRAVC